MLFQLGRQLQQDKPTLFQLGTQLQPAYKRQDRLLRTQLRLQMIGNSTKATLYGIDLRLPFTDWTGLEVSLK
jgi:hypothetical protein